MAQDELERLRAELAEERHWREELQFLTIDQAVEIGKLKSAMRETLRVLREIAQSFNARLADEEQSRQN